MAQSHFLNTKKHGLINSDSIEYLRIAQFNNLIHSMELNYKGIVKLSPTQLDNKGQAFLRVKAFFKLAHSNKTLKFVNYGDFLAAFSQSIQYEL
jgi:hypothetical protein